MAAQNKGFTYIPGNRKVVIIGSGYVGSTIAYALTLRDIAREVVLIDLDRRKVEGEVMDIKHGIPGLGTTEVSEGDYADIADSDLIIICAGRGRKPGETRLDLAGENVKIARSIVDEIQKYYTRGIILLISNPVDILTYKVTEWMELPDGMVFGSGNLLDSSRLVLSIADYVGLSTGVVNAYVVGEHGNGQVPVWSRATIGSMPIADYCKDAGFVWNEEMRAQLAKKTRDMGANIIAAKGKTHYGIATCVCQLAEAILNQKPTIASVSSVLQGEYGVRDVAVSVPSVVGPAGVQLRIRETWSDEEYTAFKAAAYGLRQMLDSL